MAYHLDFKKKAKSDLNNATQFYEEKSKDLGIEFYLEFISIIDVIENYPERYPPKLPPFRRALMKKFPYAIYFHVDEDKKEILIFAIWHIKRDLTRLLKRLNLL